MSLPGPLAALVRFLPGQGAAPAPAPPSDFRASEPGGASAPLIGLAVSLICIVAGLWIAAGFFGLPAAVAFCSNLAATAMVVAVLVPLIGLLLNYRSRNKEAAATVAVAAHQAAAQVAVAAAAQNGGAR